MELQLGVQIVFPRTIHRLLATAEEINNWTTRCGSPEFKPYMDFTEEPYFWKPYMEGEFYTGVIRQAAQIDFSTLISAYRNHLESKSRFIDREIPMDQVEDQLNEFDGVILSEGFSASENPFFRHIPWQNARGEVLEVAFEDAQFNESIANQGSIPMLKRDIMIASTGAEWGSTFWIGATYEWEPFSSKAPNMEKQLELEESLKRLLNLPFSVTARHTGIRPVVKDRRPVLGSSTENEQIIIFNGMGSKGGLQTPYWAYHLCEHILKGSPLNQEVDHRRFL